LSNAVFEQMQMRLFEAEQRLALARNHLSAATAAQTEMDVEAAENPSMVAQFTDLTREYDVLKKQYDELLVRRESALMSQAVENSSQKIQFRIVEPPRIPAKPSGPHRLLFLIAVLSGSMVAGAGLAFLLDHIDTPVTSPALLARHSKLPLLGIISLLRQPEHQAFERRWNRRFGVASLSLALIFCLLFLFTQQISGLLSNFGRSNSDRTMTHVG
jgi:hypothetical protein